MNSSRSWIALVFVTAILMPRPGRALPITIYADGHGVRNWISHYVAGDQYSTVDVQQTQSNDQGGISLSSDLGFAATYAQSSGHTLYAQASADGISLAALGYDSGGGEGDAEEVIDFEVTGSAGLVALVISMTYSVSDVSTDPLMGPSTTGTYVSHSHTFGLFDQNFQQIDPSAGDSSHLVFRLTAGVGYTIRAWANAVASVRGDSTGNAAATTTFSYVLSAVPVPEPVADLLLGIGLAALGLDRRARSRAHAVGWMME